ncbi:hypothetical protein B0I72DRAFT_140559 [Yarrowia lipolytica]|jgi:nitroimidazol reductase NimA-like FMN-containing flavoprotein (pyridoxamine 5'-phosphate oxidase superfamily)|uniref:YALI0E15906p n=2 Tax=Yarrowia lipolytica TaxID=4952 RepID=Q6C5R1_YARLI|nr:YALI0E15906p [Yarrowia lipolytica CLIB122]AOW05476.1 hypothetical protein YALI1_E19098g [Yarrowia lipolytica]KAB8280177.1 hypothetical protein BKA91DRAFT_142364 [Yarrowia lipolytica]KAE8173841.1 hypothetical protein BKA90DRAFT_135187 [Yarrowia lipolytica]KAJ8056979.1 hypothetical protein LXG23DRAFT_14754 [Yarrowia lipolytica]QNQ00127.1 Pyridoxamine 5'-phosphate oxidase [Yarrowia lipolytica]|eukprot:XP_504001.1 YALI0E15906p [Yarrowia lipolytica CLIB122]
MATLSKEVEQLLTNAGFVHLGTCHNNQPNVTLMNYTYIADEQAIVLTTRKSSTTYVNLSQNPLVSVLVHDWVTARSRVVGGQEPSLLELLQNINQNEISSMSVTLNGSARVVEDLAEAQKYLAKHEKANPDAKQFIENQEIALLLVTFKEVKVTEVDV